MKSALLLLRVALLFLTLGAAEAFARKWSDQSGKFSVEAEFVSCTEGIVVLKKSDNATVNVPLTRLSLADQSFVESLVPSAKTQTPPPDFAKRYLCKKDLLGDLQVEFQKDFYLLTSTKPGALVSTLRFSEPCQLKLILKDKTLLADSEGVTAKDDKGKTWKSKKVKMGNEDVFAFFQES